MFRPSASTKVIHNLACVSTMAKTLSYPSSQIHSLLIHSTWWRPLVLFPSAFSVILRTPNGSSCPSLLCVVLCSLLSRCWSLSMFTSTKRLICDKNLPLVPTGQYSEPLSFGHLDLSIDLILWFPVTLIEQSRCICWGIGWLSGEFLRLSHCKFHHLAKQHVVHCLRLHVPSSVQDPASHILNKFPKTPFKRYLIKNYWSFV